MGHALSLFQHNQFSRRSATCHTRSSVRVLQPFENRKELEMSTTNEVAEDRKPDADFDDVFKGAWDKVAEGVDDVTDAITSRDKIKESDEPLPAIEGEGWASLVNDPEREAPAPREAALEKIMRGREAKLAEREVTTKQFSDAKPWRDEAKRIGIEPAELLKQFMAWDDKFDADPIAAADAFAATGFRMPVHAIEDAPAKDTSKDEEYADPLDAAIAAALNGIEKAETKEFTPTAAEWKRIQAKYPGESLDDVLRRSVEVLKDLAKSPWETASRIAAAKGVPVTPGAQAAQAAEYERAAPVLEVVDRVTQHYPDLGDPSMQNDVCKVLARPEFVRTSDPEYDLIRAREIVWRLRVEQHRIQTENAEKAKPKPRSGLDGNLDRAFAQHGGA
ncbi:MAG: hypothetical protein GEU95_10380 [Rhizobiales bacterium]|nr:hypothetical protein [Hyphomicrobiales bacterium]